MAKNLIYKHIVTHKCRCEWVHEYPRGSTKREAKSAEYWAKMQLCPKCEEKGATEKTGA